jgi:hypothetical protein
MNKEITIKLYVNAPEEFVDEDFNIMIEKMKIGRAVWNSGCIFDDVEASVCDYEERVVVSRTNVRQLEVE